MDVLASVSDRSWRGRLLPQQLEDEAYLFTDIFTGVITFRWFDGEDSRAFRNPFGPTGVFGALKGMIGAVDGRDPSTVDSYLGADLSFTPRGPRVEVRSSLDSDVVLSPLREDVVGELTRCVQVTRQLVRAAYRSEPYPRLIDELSA